MEQIYNPYLPLHEHIPDGEPHVFGNRIYIYGSHDVMNGNTYCEEDYVVWSAPISSLKNWRCEGLAYRKEQDPSNPDGKKNLWAPDVTKGPDGKYYLYYCLALYPEIGVAVSDAPAGPFKFYGHVKYPEGISKDSISKKYMPFDPAVLTDEDLRVYLYFGFAPACENSMVVELEQDMLTMKEAPKILIPGGNCAKGTDFEGHGFFEASSIRKIADTYYFIYSSRKSHELCYATSSYPDRDFIYGGTIISNGDIGLNGRTKSCNVLGNNHGSIEKIGDSYYIFYHRQTNGTEFSRQGCAEKITINKDGSIDQVEITSCGLNGGPLDGQGNYPAVIACHITDPSTLDSIDYQNPVLKTQTRVTVQIGS